MKAIDIFANVAWQAATDGSVRKYGSILVSRGVAGLGKLNPTVVWIEAVAAVIEASGSYFRYCAEQEVTCQLREHNHTLEITLAQELEIGEMEVQVLCKQREGRLMNIERILAATNRHVQLSHKKIRMQLNLLKSMHILLQKERLQSGNFKELIAFQVCLDNCINATLSLLITPSGGLE